MNYLFEQMISNPTFKEFFDEPSMVHRRYGSIPLTLARMAADYDTLLEFHKTNNGYNLDITVDEGDAITVNNVINTDKVSLVREDFNLPVFFEKLEDALENYLSDEYLNDFCYELEELQDSLAMENDDRNETLALLSKQYADIDASEVLSRLTELARKTDCHISLTSNLNKPNEYVFSIIALHNGDYSNYEEVTGSLQYVPSKDGDLLEFAEKTAERNGLTKFAKGIKSIRDELTVNKDTDKVFKGDFNKPCMRHWGYGNILKTIARMAEENDMVLNFHETQKGYDLEIAVGESEPILVYNVALKDGGINPPVFLIN